MINDIEFVTHAFCWAFLQRSCTFLGICVHISFNPHMQHTNIISALILHVLLQSSATSLSEIEMSRPKSLSFRRSCKDCMGTKTVYRLHSSLRSSSKILFVTDSGVWPLNSDAPSSNRNFCKQWSSHPVAPKILSPPRPLLKVLWRRGAILWHCRQNNQAEWVRVPVGPHHLSVMTRGHGLD